MLRRSLLAALASLASLPALALAAGTPQTTYRADQYADAPHARVSYLEGELTIRGPEDPNETAATLNTVIRSGDELHTSAGSFVEVELRGDTFLRLAGGTTLVLEELDGKVMAALVTGSVYLSRGAQAAPASVIAYAGRVALDYDAMVRVDLEPGAERFVVRQARGRGEVLTDAADVMLESQQTLSYARGQSPDPNYG